MNDIIKHLKFYNEICTSLSNGRIVNIVCALSKIDRNYIFNHLHTRYPQSLIKITDISKFTNLCLSGGLHSGTHHFFEVNDKWDLFVKDCIRIIPAYDTITYRTDESNTFPNVKDIVSDMIKNIENVIFDNIDKSKQECNYLKFHFKMLDLHETEFVKGIRNLKQELIGKGFFVDEYKDRHSNVNYTWKISW